MFGQQVPSKKKKKKEVQSKEKKKNSTKNDLNPTLNLKKKKLDKK
jgi:hypothetical protein